MQSNNSAIQQEALTDYRSFDNIITIEPNIIFKSYNGEIITVPFIGQENLKDPIIASLIYGNDLAVILQYETEHIVEQNGKFLFQRQKNGRPHEIAMKILGSVAEAVIVRRCGESEEVNRKWLEVALRKSNILQTKTARKFTAIGTGLGSTRRLHPQYYDKSDKQHDVLWIDDADKCALITGSTKNAGVYAGLQIKTTSTGIQYVINALKTGKYIDPVVYFGIQNGDKNNLRSIYYQEMPVKPGIDFINAQEIDNKAYEEVMADYHILYALITRELSIEQFLNKAEDNHAIKGALACNYLGEKEATILIA